MRWEAVGADPPGTTEAVCGEGLSGTGAGRCDFDSCVWGGVSCCGAGDDPDRLYLKKKNYLS